MVRMLTALAVVSSICVVAPGLASAQGGSASVWDHVPPGGGIRFESDGTITIVDKDLNDVAKIPPGAKDPVPVGPAPDPLKGTVWDHVPPGGAIRIEADGTITILDKDLKEVGKVPPGAKEPVPCGDAAGPAVPQPLPPIVTPTAGGGTITSTQKADGTWSHHYHRETADFAIDTELSPQDDLYPHDDPRFWTPGQSSGHRVVTRTPGGGTITSTRNPDGSWTHRYRRETDMGVVDFQLTPEDSMYPKDDPRFAPPDDRRAGVSFPSEACEGGPEVFLFAIPRRHDRRSAGEETRSGFGCDGSAPWGR